MDTLAQLVPQLKHLRFSGLLESLELRNRQAVEERLSYVEFLSRLFEDEIERRAQKQLHLRLRRSGLRSVAQHAAHDVDGGGGASGPLALVDAPGFGAVGGVEGSRPVRGWGAGSRGPALP